MILPEIVQLQQDPSAVILLGRGADALRVGDNAVILETMREPDGPDLPLATQTFEVALATGSHQGSAPELQCLLIGASFGNGSMQALTVSA